MKLSLLILGVASLVPSAASAEMLAVKTASASFRAQPSDKSAVVYSADKFYPVEVLERKNGWVKAKDFEGDTAWVAERSLGKMDTIVIDTPTANIREKAATNAEVLFKVAHGEVFKVEDHKENWLKVKDAHGDGGWIRADKTWGVEGEGMKGALDKGAKGDDDKKARSDENAKTSHADKKHDDKIEKKPEASDKKPEEVQFICKAAVADKPDVKVAHADLTKSDKSDKSDKSEKSEKTGKASHEKASHDKLALSHDKPGEAHAQKSQRPAHAKGNGHVKKSARVQKKPAAQHRRNKK